MTDQNAMTPQLFERISTLCEKYTGRPWDGTGDHLAQCLDVQDAASDVLDAHGTWLSATRAAVERQGLDWTHAELRRQSRLSGDLTTPPEWLCLRGVS